MSKIIFFDVDGTLMTTKNILPESTKQAIKELKEVGHIPVISTGRPPGMLESVAEELGVENYISLNGQYIVIQGEPIYSNPLPTDELEQLIETSYEQGDRTFLLTHDKVIGNTFMSEMMDPDFLTYVYTHLHDLPLEVTLELFKHMTEKPLPRDRYENEDILTAFVNTSEANDDFYREHFPNLHYTRATPFIGEALMKGSHKAAGVERIVKYFEMKMTDTIAFGDSLNDIEMLEAVETGVAMGNGREELKNIADYVTADVEDDGIYKGLERLELI